MIYCVVPEALSEQLYDRLARYYADDDNVTVIVDRRLADRRAGDAQDGMTRQQREVRDRRRARIPGEFPPLESAVSERNGHG